MRDPDLHGLVHHRYRRRVHSRRRDEQPPRGRHVRGIEPYLGGVDILPFQTLRRSLKPVIASVNGICQGGGLIIAMCSDICVASERAVFRAPETLRGVVDVNLGALLPAHVGVALARDLLMTGRRVPAAEAVQMGLIARMCAHDDLEARDRARGTRPAQGRARDALGTRSASSIPATAVIDEMTFAASLTSDEIRRGLHRVHREARAQLGPRAVPHRRTAVALSRSSSGASGCRLGLRRSIRRRRRCAR